MRAILTTALSLTAAILPASAGAVPLELAHTGELTDADGPVTGSLTMTFRLFDSAVGGDDVWEEERSVEVVDGFYSVLLGSEEPIEAVLLDEPALWLEVTIENGSPLLPRQAVVSVPYSVAAGTATNVEGGSVDASGLAVNGLPVVDGGGAWVGPAGSIDWSSLDGVPAGLEDGDSDTLGGLSCSDGGVAKYELGSGLWVCGTDLVLTESEVLGFVDGAVLDLGDGSAMGGAGLATLDDLAGFLVQGDPIDAASVSVGGVAVIDGAGDWVGDPGSVPWSALDGVPADIGGGCTINPIDPVTAELDCGLGGTARLRTRPQFVQVETSAGANCGRLLDGSLYCWGDDPYLQGWPAGTGFIDVGVHGAGYGACAIDGAGGITCWGALSSSWLLSPPSGSFADLDVGNAAACGVRTNGSLACWGTGPAASSAPSTGTYTKVELASDGGLACAIQTSGNLTCWPGSPTPPVGAFQAVVPQSGIYCGVTTAGSPICWTSTSTHAGTGPNAPYEAVAANGGIVWFANSAGQVDIAGVGASTLDFFATLGRPLTAITGPPGICGIDPSSSDLVCFPTTFPLP